MDLLRSSSGQQRQRLEEQQQQQSHHQYQQHHKEDQHHRHPRSPCSRPLSVLPSSSIAHLDQPATRDRYTQVLDLSGFPSQSYTFVLEPEPELMSPNRSADPIRPPDQSSPDQTSVDQVSTPTLSQTLSQTVIPDASQLNLSSTSSGSALSSSSSDTTDLASLPLSLSLSAVSFIPPRPSNLTTYPESRSDRSLENSEAEQKNKDDTEANDDDDEKENDNDEENDEENDDDDDGDDDDDDDDDDGEDNEEGENRRSFQRWKDRWKVVQDCLKCPLCPPDHLLTQPETIVCGHSICHLHYSLAGYRCPVPTCFLPPQTIRPDTLHAQLKSDVILSKLVELVSARSKAVAEGRLMEVEDLLIETGEESEVERLALGLPNSDPSTRITPNPSPLSRSTFNSPTSPVAERPSAAKRLRRHQRSLSTSSSSSSSSSSSFATSKPLPMGPHDGVSPANLSLPSSSASVLPRSSSSSLPLSSTLPGSVSRSSSPASSVSGRLSRTSSLNRRSTATASSRKGKPRMRPSTSAQLAGSSTSPARSTKHRMRTSKHPSTSAASVSKQMDISSDSLGIGQFERDLLSLLECDICASMLYEPVTTTCGHTYCRSCLSRSMDHSLKCPICRSDLQMMSSRNMALNKVLHIILNTAFEEECTERKAFLDLIEQQASQDTPIFVCTLAFPHMPTILHVFEPRYRLMLRRCIESNAPRFGMTLPPRPGSAVRYGTMLEIRTVQAMADGRSMVETVGSWRFKILETSTLDGYSVGKVERINDITFEDEVELERAALIRATTARRARSNPSSSSTPAHPSPLPTTSSTEHVFRTDIGEDLIPTTMPTSPSRTAARPNARSPHPPPPPGSPYPETNSDGTLMDTPADMSTVDLLLVCRSFVSHLRSGSAPWLLQRLNNTYGPMPTDPSLCSFWMASVIPIDEFEKAKLLPIRSPRLRLALVVHWIEQLRASWWFSSGCVCN